MVVCGVGVPMRGVEGAAAEAAPAEDAQKDKAVEDEEKDKAPPGMPPHVLLRWKSRRRVTRN